MKSVSKYCTKKRFIRSNAKNNSGGSRKKYPQHSIREETEMKSVSKYCTKNALFGAMQKLVAGSSWKRYPQLPVHSGIDR